MSKYAGRDVYQRTSSAGGTIQKALDFMINRNPGKEAASELYPNVAAVGAIYGDPNGKYARFLAYVGETYAAKPYFLWDQPFSDYGWVSHHPTYGEDIENGSSGSEDNNGGAKAAAGTISLVTLSILAAWLLAPA